MKEMIRIGYKPAFVRQFGKLPAALQREVRDRIAMFQEDPRHPMLYVHPSTHSVRSGSRKRDKLKGRLRGRWSFSVNYRYRVVFTYEDQHTAVLLAVGDHGVYA